MNYIQTIEKLQSEITNELETDGLFRKSTCGDHYNWNRMEHEAMNEIQRKGIPNASISRQVRWGVTDWIIKKHL